VPRSSAPRASLQCHEPCLSAPPPGVLAEVVAASCQSRVLESLRLTYFPRRPPPRRRGNRMVAWIPAPPT
jgi:hypothetical protein